MLVLRTPQLTSLLAGRSYLRKPSGRRWTPERARVEGVGKIADEAAHSGGGRPRKDRSTWSVDRPNTEKYSMVSNSVVKSAIRGKAAAAHTAMTKSLVRFEEDCLALSLTVGSWRNCKVATGHAQEASKVWGVDISPLSPSVM